MRQFVSRQFLTFLATGGTAATVNFGSRLVYNDWVDYSTSVIVAYLTGMVTAWVLAYWLLPAMGGTQGACEIAHAVGIVVPVFTSYVGHKRWTFR